MFFEVQVDDRSVLQALDKAGPAFDARLKREAKFTGDRVASEARARLRRQQTAEATGHAASTIVARESSDGKEIHVYMGVPADLPSSLDIWLEFGTRHGQRPRPHLQPSAALEAGPHRRRVAIALDEEIRRLGLG